MNWLLCTQYIPIYELAILYGPYTTLLFSNFIFAPALFSHFNTVVNFITDPYNIRRIYRSAIKDYFMHIKLGLPSALLASFWLEIQFFNRFNLFKVNIVLALTAFGCLAMTCAQCTDDPLGCYDDEMGVSCHDMGGCLCLCIGIS